MEQPAVGQSFPSLCPQCLRSVTARVEVVDRIVYSVKTCEEHGRFSDVLSHDAEQFAEAHRLWDPGSPPCGNPRPAGGKEGCPYQCPTCDRHRTFVAAALIDVTHRCNLDCRICYANSGYRSRIPDPSAEQIVRVMRAFRERQVPPPKHVQLSGGEPTLRDDLPYLVRQASELGFEEIGINTNGIRLAQSVDLCRELIDCGVNKISLQFDGVDDSTYRRIRNQDLFRFKVQVIENVRKLTSGVVQLVCAIGNDLNDQEIPAILDFAAANSDVVSGVSFLPIAFCGREFSLADVSRHRMTMPQVQLAINKHTGGVCRNWLSTHSLIHSLRFVLHVLDGRPIGHSAHPECVNMQIVRVTQERGGRRQWLSLCDLLDLPRIESASEALWRRYQDRKRKGALGFQIMRARMIWILLRHASDKRRVALEATAWLLARIMRLARGARLGRLGNVDGLFRNKRYLSLFCVNFQDLYNLNVERLQHCTFHYGYYDPGDDQVRTMPVCSMNAVHRKVIEEKLIDFAERRLTQRA